MCICLAYAVAALSHWWFLLSEAMRVPLNTYPFPWTISPVLELDQHGSHASYLCMVSHAVLTLDPVMFCELDYRGRLYPHVCYDATAIQPKPSALSVCVPTRKAPE